MGFKRRKGRGFKFYSGKIEPHLYISSADPLFVKLKFFLFSVVTLSLSPDVVLMKVFFSASVKPVDQEGVKQCRTVPQGGHHLKVSLYPGLSGSNWIINFKLCVETL